MIPAPRPKSLVVAFMLGILPIGAVLQAVDDSAPAADRARPKSVEAAGLSSEFVQDAAESRLAHGPGCGPCRLYGDLGAYYCIVDSGDLIAVANALGQDCEFVPGANLVYVVSLPQCPSGACQFPGSRCELTLGAFPGICPSCEVFLASDCVDGGDRAPRAMSQDECVRAGGTFSGVGTTCP